MIHCFNAGQKCCSGLCDLCGNVCQTCAHCSADLCGGCEQTCKNCCRPIVAITSRPLGCFVIIAAVLNIPAAAVALSSLSNPAIQECEVRNFCYGAVGIALMNVAFSLYLQWRLDLSIRSGNEQGARALIQEATQIVLYDVGFCIYVIVFVFSVVFSFMGIGWSSDCPARDSGPLWAAVFLLLFAFWTGMFSCCWGLTAGCWGALESFGISSSFANLFFGRIANAAREPPAFVPSVPAVAVVRNTQSQNPGAAASQALYAGR